MSTSVKHGNRMWPPTVLGRCNLKEGDRCYCMRSINDDVDSINLDSMYETFDYSRLSKIHHGTCT
jgi:hypothetical protein